MAIAVKQVAAGQGQRLVGHPHEMTQADHGGEQGVLANPANRVMLKPLRLPLQHHHHRTTPGGDVEGLVGRV